MKTGMEARVLFCAETFWSFAHNSIKTRRNIIHWPTFFRHNDRIDLIFFGHSQKNSACDQKMPGKNLQKNWKKI